MDFLSTVGRRVSSIGEVRLDFSPRFAGTEATQLQAFEQLCQTLPQHPLAERVVSIHAVRSAGAMLAVVCQ